MLITCHSTRLGSRILTGYAQPIQEQPFAIRTAILQSWRVSYLPPLRVIYRGLTMAAKNTFIKTSLSFPKATGYVPFPDHYKPGPHFEYEFMQFPAGEEPVVLETDVIIVGSGCGGGVCAKNLAEAGHKVMVVDKSYYFTPSQLPMSEGNAGINLYENGGLEASVDGSMSVLAGSCWGGGGTVNWSASLQTQDFVRKEWAEDRGLTFFGSQEYQDCMDRVCGHMGVGTDHIRHNHGNRVILEGSKKLGWPAKEVPQNTGGNEHYCGHCTLGCGAAQKQGPVVAWLPDAQKAGAKFMEGFHVDKVLFEEVNGVKTAVGVQGVWTSRGKNGTTQGPLSDKTIRPIIVRAKKVIISSGTLWSPMVLLKSGLTVSLL
jgi:choline dehydrogenase-like flavoprotein